MSSRVMVIGLDCAPPQWVFDRWLDDLPHLRRLTGAGIYGALESTIPPITVPAWMSMMTGRDPGTLGVYGFRNRKDHTYTGLSFASSRLIKEPTVWDLCARHDKKVVVMGVPLTYPPRPVNGLLICGFLAPGRDNDYTYPPELKDELAKIAPDYELDVRDFRTDDKDYLLRQIDEMTTARFNLAIELARSRPWDLFIMVEMGTDRIHHGFWSFMDPEHRKYVPGNPYEHTIHDYYVRLDAHIGRLLEAVPDDTVILVVSDHGAQKMDGGICFNEWLIKEGYLAVKNYPESISRMEKIEVDWENTRAWGDGGYYGRLFLNVQGREPQGVIPPGEYEAVRSELIRKLEAITDEDGRSIGTRVYRPEDVYQQANNVPPDLIVYFGNLDWRSVGSIGHRSIWTRENDTGPDDANHARQGMLILTGAAGSTVGRRDGMRIYDVLPTLCDLLELTPPGDLVGKSLLR
ncbi:MAG: alkaline phosphatase family protein [Chloroflexi bacterium]|nr:alkaline phosphatase family protein [Chloroflexota bacterium]